MRPVFPIICTVLVLFLVCDIQGQLVPYGYLFPEMPEIGRVIALILPIIVASLGVTLSWIGFLHSEIRDLKAEVRELKK